MVRFGIKEPHAAGIWSDMSGDGPIIGDLVVILDRAKNLPNKKKIGKQDPYAVARLAKEAKRTDTDVRGGQVPKWDKELRFHVRDSPDYKSLKISVFNDDKKVDLIGETTLRLDKILVKGGGTDDGWRQLKCKEKYAGDILVELTFYDLRPKESESTPERPRQTQSSRHPKGETVAKRLGGAREMGARDPQPKSRRQLAANPARDSGDERRATRKSRHSYHPESSTRSRAEHDHGQRSSRDRDLRRSQSRYFEESQDMEPRDRDVRRSRSRYFDEDPEYRDRHSRDRDRDRDLRRSQSRYFEQDVGQHDRLPRDRDLRHSQSRYFEQPQSMERQDSQPRDRDLRHSQSRYFEEQQHDMRRSRSGQFEQPAELSRPRSMHLDGAQDLRRSSSRYFEDTANGMIMAPQAIEHSGPLEIYDPHPNDDFIPGAGAGDLDDGYDEGPPPPPPAHGPPPPVHRMTMHGALPMQHSLSAGPPEPSLQPPDQLEQQLRHFRSVPAFHPGPEQPDLHPTQYGSYQESNYTHQPARVLPSGSFQETDGMEIAPLRQPSTSMASSQPISMEPAEIDAPPPPPPPHRALPPLPPPEDDAPPPIDEPNWENHRPRSMLEEHGLPSYDSVAKPPPAPMTNAIVRRASFTPGDLPPSLIPGIDPTVAEHITEQRLEVDRRMSTYDAPVQPLRVDSQRPRASTNYHSPQVEEVRDVQLYEPGVTAGQVELNLAAEQPKRPNTLKKKDPRLAAMVRPVAMHGETDGGLPALGPKNSHKRLPSAEPPKPLPGPPPEPILGSTPFSPDSYDVINPNPSAALAAAESNYPPEAILVPGTNRVLDPSDVLPTHTHAPEPEPRRRAPRAPPPVPIQHRRETFARRSLSPQPPPRGPRLSLPAPDQPQQLVVKQVSFDDSAPSERSRNKLRKSVRASRSMAALPAPEPSSISGGLVLYDPHSEREREREADRQRAERDARALVPSRRVNEGYYSQQPPQLPPKIPMRTGTGTVPAREAELLSQEMSMISIGPIATRDSRRGRY